MRRLSFCLFGLLLWIVGQQQGCLCVQNVVIPGWEGNTTVDGTSQVQDGGQDGATGTEPTPEQTTQRDKLPQDTSPPDASPQDAPVPEQVQDKAGTTGCPNPQDVMCEHCRISLGAKENVFLFHRDYVLTQEAGQFKLYNVKTCQSQPFVWSGIESLAYGKADPDSARVLLLGTGKPDSGGFAPLRLGIFDLEQPGQPLRELALPSGSFFGASRSALDSGNRRGVLAFPRSQGQTASDVFIHYQMEGASLQQMKLPDGHQIYRYVPTPTMFPDYEIYVLQAPTGREFPIAIWSVKDQRIVRILDRSGHRSPQAVFASSQDVFTLDPDPQDRTKRQITVYPIAGGNPIQLSAPGCQSFFGDNAAGILFCLAKDEIHRFQLPARTPLPLLKMNIEPRFVAYFSGKVYLAEQTKPHRLWMSNLLDPKPNLKEIAKSLPDSFYVAGPEYPTQRSRHTLPGPAYRVLRGTVDGKNRHAILDLQRDQVKLIAEDFPTPAVMGRQTEYWRFLQSSFSYLVEPQANPQRPMIYFVRNDTAAVFHRETPIAEPYSFSGGIQVAVGTGQVEVLGQTRYIQGPPPKTESEILVVHHQHYKVQKLKLNRTYRVFHSDHFLLLGPYDAQDARELKVYRIP